MPFLPWSNVDLIRWQIPYINLEHMAKNYTFSKSLFFCNIRDRLLVCFCVLFQRSQNICQPYQVLATGQKHHICCRTSLMDLVSESRNLRLWRIYVINDLWSPNMFHPSLYRWLCSIQWQVQRSSFIHFCIDIEFNSTYDMFRIRSKCYRSSCS